MKFHKKLSAISLGQGQVRTRNKHLKSSSLREWAGQLMPHPYTSHIMWCVIHCCLCAVLRWVYYYIHTGSSCGSNDASGYGSWTVGVLPELSPVTQLDACPGTVDWADWARQSKIPNFHLYCTSYVYQLTCTIVTCMALYSKHDCRRESWVMKTL